MEYETMISSERIENACRICLLEEGITSIYAVAEQENVEIKIHEVLQSYTNSQIDEDDILPKYICQKCLMDLLKTYEFIKKCKQSDEILQQIKSVKKENELELEEQVNVELVTSVDKDTNMKTSPVQDNVEHNTTTQTSKINTDSSRTTCKICSRSIKNHRLKRHMAVHYRNKPYVCYSCSAEFSAMRSLVRHLKIHTEEKHKCDVCSKEFSRSSYLNDHKNIHFDTKPYCCHICAETFYSSNGLNRHLVRHNPLLGKTCKVCNKNYQSRSAYYTHMKVHRDKGILCSLCGKQFAQQSNFLRHWSSHTGERPFQCDICSKKFACKVSLISHKLLHNGQKPNECIICLKSFAQKYNLKRHLLLHKGVKAHACEYCGRKFAEKCNLVVHTRIHTGETPHHCGICSKKFSDRGGLKKHIKTYHQQQAASDEQHNINA